MPTFRLDQEPWIPVVRRDGSAEELSLTAVFKEADQIASLGGSPVEAISISRFLLAIVHLVDTPTSLDNWRKLWEDRAGLMNRCVSYVQQQKDTWDLFHSGHPFGQLPEQDKTQNPAHILVYEAARKNNPVHADHRLTEAPLPVRPSVLARGMIATNAYAGSSGGGYRSGPLCMRTTALLEGGDLAQTLLLNLIVQDTEPLPFDWTTYGRSVPPTDLDIVRRYLWHSRSVRLLPEDGGSVRGIMLAPGNEMPEDQRKSDPMIAFRLDSKGKEYVPLRLEPARVLWRSAHVLLNWHQDARRLAGLDQLNRLCTRRYISDEALISLRVCAVAGDAQGPSTDLWRDETLPFGLAVIRSEERFATLQRAVQSAEEKASDTRRRIYSFAARYLQNGAESKPDRADVGKLADELSPDLHDYWSVLAPMGERIACDGFDEKRWAELLEAASESAFNKAIERLPADARRFRAQYARTPAKEKAAV